MEPSPKKRKLAPKITNPDPISPTAVNSTLHTNTASYPSEPVSFMPSETSVPIIVAKDQTDSPLQQQQYPVQDAAAAAAAALASNPERHDFESFARHLQDAATLIEEQSKKQAEILACSKVSVLLLRWADDPTASADIDALESTLQSQYHFHTQRWLIPSDPNPTLKLLQHLATFLDNAPRNHLLIIYYAGYGFMKSDEQLYWASNARNDAAKVKWDGIRCLLEDTVQDVLLLLDTCALPDAVASGRHGVKQGIAACTPEMINREEGRSFTSYLNDALRKLGNGRPFSVQRLLEEVQGQKQHRSKTESPTVANGDTHEAPLAAQPVFFTLAKGNGQSLTLAPSTTHPVSSPENDANEDSKPQVLPDYKVAEAQTLRKLRFDEARVLVCTTFVGDASPDMGFYKKWLQSPPASANNIIVEGMFLGPPTMLLISMPHSVWTVVQHDQVCCYLGFIQSHNMLHLYQRLISTGDAQPWLKGFEAGAGLLEGHEMSIGSPTRARANTGGSSSSAARNGLSSKDHRGFHAINSSPGSSFNAGGKVKTEVQDSAEMQEAAEQLKALSHVRTRSDEGAASTQPSGDRQRTTLPDSIPDVRGQERGRPLPDSAEIGGLLNEPQISPGPKAKAPRRALPKQESRCNHCTHAPFKDSTALRKHILAAHTRPFPCAFSFAGCSSTFGSKNEWKRHIASQHLCLTYYRCSSCSKTTVDGKGNEFNRKDLFTQHLRRMHAPHDIRRALQKGEAKSEAEWDARVRELQQSCLVTRRRPPQRSACPKEGCSMTFEGPSAWDDWTEHVGRHMEKGEAQRLGVDSLLTQWALEEGVIEPWGDGEYRLTAGSSVGGGPYTSSWPSERHAHARRRSSATAYSTDKSPTEATKPAKASPPTAMEVDTDV